VHALANMTEASTNFMLMLKDIQEGIYHHAELLAILIKS